MSARTRAIAAANRELLLLYWSVGRVIVEQAEWGSQFIPKLSKDIRSEFPDLKGFSVRNLKYMRKFAEVFHTKQIVQTLSAQLSWSHVVLLLERVRNVEEMMWYASQTGENGWSVRVLDHQIATDVFSRQVTASKVSNFERVLESDHANAVSALMKDPYVFDLLSFGADMSELDIERDLVKNVTKTLLEFGHVFSFVGRQVHLEVGGDDFYLDLLFYHLRLHCYVVVDLKMGKFTPEQAGKMNFYLSAVDDLIKMPEDKPTIGLILCREGNSVVAEYALRDMTKPIGVSRYRFISELPDTMKFDLPDANEFSERVVQEMQASYSRSER